MTAQEAPTGRFTRCDGCFTDRMCYEYEGRWLCKGPQRCWFKRKLAGKKEPRKQEPRRKR